MPASIARHARRAIRVPATSEVGCSGDQPLALAASTVPTLCVGLSGALVQELRGVIEVFRTGGSASRDSAWSRALSLEVFMDRKLHLLESFTAQGSDGATYKVCAYEHLVKDDAIVDAGDRWESTGLTEYRLADGARVDVHADGSMQIAGSGVGLSPPH